MKYVMAFALGVLVCFVVMRTIDNGDRDRHVQTAVASVKPSGSDVATNAPTPPYDAGRAPDSTRSTATPVPAGSNAAREHLPAGPRRPASELIDDMITS